MQSNLGHLVFSVQPANMPFYKNLMTFLGWSTLYDSPEMLGFGDKNSVSLWFGGATKEGRNDYDAPGVNHIAISTAAQADVDAAAAHLSAQDIAMLFETPRHRPDFMPPPQTYYQIMFESPDRILFEVVYTGPKD
jgi:catechol 2,3-dioxygenase-like lactoylglutathione lyase family enzyme